MSLLLDTKDSILNVLNTVTVVDFIDIAILSYLVYLLIKLVRETRAGQLVKGIVLLALGYLISSIVGLKSLKYIISTAFDIGLIAIIILFQPELRRALEKV